MKRLALLHPFLFTLASIVYLYLGSAVVVSPDQILRPLLLLWFVLVMLAWPAYRISGRDWHQAGLFLTLFSLAFFSASSFFLVALTASAIALLPWVAYSFLRGRKIKMEPAGLLLNVVSFLLVITFAYPLVLRLTAVPVSYYTHVLNTNPPLPAKLAEPQTKPDIYYIVLDAYARADILDELYHFDNSDFIHVLESQGFIVPTRSHSNYPKTALSVTSTLNMDYIDSLAPGLQDSYFWWLMAPLIDHSRTRAMLQKLGYQSISITTDWSITDNPSVDIYYQPAAVVLTDFETYLLDTTPLGAAKSWLAKIAFVPSNDAHRELVRYNFETLGQIPALPGPKFVFAHITAPHPPFVFDSDGNPIQPGYPFSFNDANDYPFSDEQYRLGYIGQVQYINRRLEQLIISLLQNSKTPPIIILQADHGPGMLTDFRSSENTCIKERFSNFAAYYLPGMQPDTIPQDITPVNVFRIIFNEYFDARLPLLHNSYYYYKDTVYIYRAEDVSSQINIPCQLPP